MEMFTNAYFGKMYKTRDGRRARYDRYSDIFKQHRLLVEGDGINFYTKSGDHECGRYTDENLDIVSEWIEKDKKNPKNKIENWIMTQEDMKYFVENVFGVTADTYEECFDKGIEYGEHKVKDILKTHLQKQEWERVMAILLDNNIIIDE